MYQQFMLGSGKTINIQDYPGECPKCHSKTTPNFKTYHITKKDNNLLYSFLICPNPKCEAGYIAEYNTAQWNANPVNYRFSRIFIGQPKKADLSKTVTEFSPGFGKIYNQSFYAEQIGLDEIAGVGYRKSLEFLIKDYLIQKIADENDNIKKTPLGQCINKWVDDPRIKKAAKRAAWLGNDQTHYEKRWENKDINDLKLLIKLTVNWVESEILTEELESDMPE